MQTWLRSALLAIPIFLLLQLPSCFAVYRYSPWPEAALALIFASYVACFWMAATQSWPVRLLDNWIVGAAFLLGLWAAIHSLYFYVKSLPATPTSDTALMAPIQALRLGRGMYDLEGLIAVPASPGPAWALFNAPFTFTGVSSVYTLMTPSYVLLGWLALRFAGHSLRLANMWMLLLFSGLISWELAVGGYDIIALSVMVMVLYLLVERFSLGGISWASVLVAVGVGLFATARIVFPYLILLFGLIIAKRDRRHAVAFMLIAFSITAVIHATFYLQSEVYHPFHLFDRAESKMGLPAVAAGGVSSAIILIAAFFKMRENALSRLGWFALALSTPFVFISIGELASNNWRLQGWEGGNYLVPVAATAILYVLRKLDVDGSRQAIEQYK